MEHSLCDQWGGDTPQRPPYLTSMLMNLPSFFSVPNRDSSWCPTSIHPADPGLSPPCKKKLSLPFVSVEGDGCNGTLYLPQSPRRSLTNPPSDISEVSNQ